MFILMSGWRQTDLKLSIEDRMSNTFRSSAISVTITSLTDLLAFCIGATSPFLSVKHFCIYAGLYILTYKYILCCPIVVMTNITQNNMEMYNEEKCQNTSLFCEKIRPLSIQTLYASGHSVSIVCMLQTSVYKLFVYFKSLVFQ